MKKWNVVAILALAQFVMVLDSTVMNVSISTVVGDLHTSVNSLQTAITFYTLTMAALMLIGAKLSARWGLLRAFVIGSIVYGIGSFITGVSQNIQTLMIGWSVIEGLGAVLVIPAIAALIAVNYKGKDRVTAYALIGGVSGAAAAAGPLIGGYVTTYLSWRYVFFVETLIMAVVLLLARSFKSSGSDTSQKVDIPSALLSASGMVLLVFGLLQSKVWGWVAPLGKPVIAGHEIAPLGISLVAYLIVLGILLLKLFYDRQVTLEAAKQSPLVSVSILKIQQLRSGLSVLAAQYVVTAAVFFVAPIYLQMVLGFNALQTGKKIMPLSVALIIFSIVGSSLTNKFSPRRIVKTGQWFLVLGSISLVAAIDPELTGYAYAISMFAVGSGLGLMASQIGNINMSAVDESKGSEVGGLQGSFQNLGSSLGTALIGSVLIASLTSGFINRIQSATLPDTIKTYISTKAQNGVQIVPANEVKSYALSQGVSDSEAESISTEYTNAQVSGLREASFFLVIISVLALVLSRGLPAKAIKNRPSRA